MSSPRRVGTETSKTRAVLLDSTEQLMLDKGYAGVTYRSVAAKAGVTAGLVQYYFPTLDDLFIALLRRRSERNLERLVEALDVHADQPLRVVWEFSRDETTAALMMEFMALANHRKVIRAEIADVTERARKVQLDALSARWREYGLADLSPTALLFLMAGIPKMILLEEAFGLSTAHAEVLRLVERRLDSVEPRKTTRKPSTPNAKKEHADSKAEGISDDR
jgi:TetR/AcrR family transcriptional repressor of nem operon